MNARPADDVVRLLRLRRVIRELDPNGPPRAHYLAEGEAEHPARLALLPGSFNPPTSAHLALAEAALKTGLVDRVDFLLATRTVNKERVEGATLADRVLMLEALVDRRSDLGIVLVNRGLYVDQAETIRRGAPAIADLWFVVGFDKIVQIFDPRYYEDRDVALDRLFALARFFVAPRGVADFDNLEALLNRPENHRYARGVVRLDLPASYRQVSSSRLRSHDPLALADVPEVVRRFIRQTGAYGTPQTGLAAESEERYLARERVLVLVEGGTITVSSPAEFRSAVERIRHDVVAGLRPSSREGRSEHPAPRLPRVDRS